MQPVLSNSGIEAAKPSPTYAPGETHFTSKRTSGRNALHTFDHFHGIRFVPKNSRKHGEIHWPDLRFEMRNRLENRRQRPKTIPENLKLTSNVSARNKMQTGRACSSTVRAGDS
jgi:hypothetical protein